MHQLPCKTPHVWHQLTYPHTLFPAPCLSLHCQGLDEVVDRVEVLTQLVADGQDVLAQQWATSLGRDYQVQAPPASTLLATHGSFCRTRMLRWPPWGLMAGAPHGAVPAVCCHQVSFVEACVALDRLKPAARAVRQLKLGAEFPNVEALYRQRSLARLVGKRLWPVALSYAGSEVSLQVFAGRRWWQASS